MRQEGKVSIEVVNGTARVEIIGDSATVASIFQELKEHVVIQISKKLDMSEKQAEFMLSAGKGTKSMSGAELDVYCRRMAFEMFNMGKKDC